MHARSENDSRTILNILSKARELFNRLAASYADEKDIRILIFGIEDINKAYEYLPKEQIEAYECNNIKEMCDKIWKITRDNEFENRIYLVLTNWQWKYVEPLLRLKSARYKFFYEAALDVRGVEEIKREVSYEKIAKIDAKEGRFLRLLDMIGSNVSTDLKG